MQISQLGNNKKEENKKVLLVHKFNAFNEK